MGVNITLNYTLKVRADRSMYSDRVSPDQPGNRTKMVMNHLDPLFNYFRIPLFIEIFVSFPRRSITIGDWKQDSLMGDLYLILGSHDMRLRGYK